jgi:hypothetical protein
MIHPPITRPQAQRLYEKVTEEGATGPEMVAFAQYLVDSGFYKLYPFWRPFLAAFYEEGLISEPGRN